MNFNLVDRIQPDFDPEKYVVDEGLHHAAEVAFALRQPLLLTGEPGTGKTRFANKMAYELAKQNGKSKYLFLDKPLVFNTKTNSSARDLFYTYDTLAHFQSANIRRNANESTPGPLDFIELQALGKAIAQTDPENIPHPKLKKSLLPNALSTVVLIDEIDKAPRDFPNDILNEIEDYEYVIREFDSLIIKKVTEVPIMVIMTSNSEKNLPDAFLRRCVFYHIPFPDQDRLRAIAKTSLGTACDPIDKQLDALIELFEDIRKKSLRKAPGIAEMLAWLRVIGVQNIEDMEHSESKRKMKENLSILVKTREDYDAVKTMFST